MTLIIIGMIKVLGPIYWFDFSGILELVRFLYFLSKNKNKFHFQNIDFNLNDAFENTLK